MTLLVPLGGVDQRSIMLLSAVGSFDLRPGTRLSPTKDCLARGADPRSKTPTQARQKGVDRGARGANCALGARISGERPAVNTKRRPHSLFRASFLGLLRLASVATALFEGEKNTRGAGSSLRMMDATSMLAGVDCGVAACQPHQA